AMGDGGRRVVVAALPEEELAGGVLRAVRGESRRVLFTTGHGERAPGGDPASYGRLTSALGAENYTAGGISLLDGPVPTGTDLLIVAGPKHDFLAPERDPSAASLHSPPPSLLLLPPL